MSRFMSLIYDRFMRSSERACLGAWRAELLAGLTGGVLEIGAGTGVNLAAYPQRLTRLVLSEPDPHMRAKLRIRARAFPRVEIVSADVDRLPFPDATFDAVVCTLVLCSVADVDRALAEIRRVLCPGGALVYLEHVAAEDGSRRLTWQRRLEPAWSRLAGNCHLTRCTSERIREAGFTIEHETRASVRKALPIVRPSVRGVARRLGAGV